MKSQKEQSTFFAILSLGYGGAEKRITEIASAYLSKSQGYLLINGEQKVASQRKDQTKTAISNLEKNHQLIATPIPRIKSVTFRRLTSLLLASFELLKKRPSHTHLALGAILLAPIAKLTRSHVTIEITSPDNANFVQKFKNVILPFTDNIIYVSESIRISLNTNIKIPARIKQDVYAHPFFKIRQLPDIKKERLVTFCARLIPRKNGILFARSIKLALETTDTPFEVAIIGDGPDRPYIEEILKQEIDDGRVTVGPSPNPTDIINRSSVFVSLIQPENYPSQSILEAMNCQNYLILSNSPLSTRFMQDNGITVALNEESVASEIIQAMRDIDKTTESGKNSLEFLRSAYSSDLIIHQLRALHSKA